ncbi:MAG: UDP-N-acetylglucosamine 2-epimerase (non-hydrolyzing) [Candidatus Omnitrophica bacterium]|nr:UDP-N-acetylglucosamine 2-epimerase (non-hydrolyzing) [Candidatus Omnitrophota bacterium]
MERILFAIGTRPEIIKTAPVIIACRKDKRYTVKVCFTGQHKAMAMQMIDEFGIKIDYDLRLMKPQQSLNYLASATLAKINAVYDDFCPELVFVQGDTTTAFCAALAAFYKEIKVAHIEAGLRTYDKHHPYPEEVNRQMVSRLADFHFAPTKSAKSNLVAEGIKPSLITITGNTVIDALLYTKTHKKYFTNKILEGLPKNKKVILVTAHRRESFGGPLKDVCTALKALVKNNKDIFIVYPVHLNPKVLKPVHSLLGKEKNILLIPPLGYSDFILLMDKAYCILTDSGGVQEEAPSLGKPVLILRDKTERPEVVRAGCAKIVGRNPARIIKYAQKLLRSKKFYRSLSMKKNPVGDGRAAARIKKKIDSV